MKISVLGIDIGKNVFHLYGTDGDGRHPVRKRLSRAKLMRFMATLEPCVAGMEACGGSHHLARVFQSYGHEVRLMSPQFVKPYVKSNKNDELDAEGVWEAMQRPTMRFVGVKSVHQQDLQTLHRARARVVSARTAQSNQIRGFLLEYGIVVARGVATLRQALPEILEDAENGLSAMTREILAELYKELVHLDARVGDYDRRVATLAKSCETCRRLQTIPGVGPVVATALVATLGDPRVYRSGREFAASVGLVPRQHSTGGQHRLLGISKRGDAYLRAQLIHGARSVVSRDPGGDRRRHWASELKARRGMNVASVALANKIARTAWALMARGGTYEAGQA